MRARRAKTPPSAPVEAARTVLLAPVLDLKAAAPLADEFLALMGNDVRVDASDVQRLGAQCLQVLLAARRRWQADKAAFEVFSPSEQMRSVVTLLGAADALFGPLEMRV